METDASKNNQREQARSQRDGRRSETETVPSKPWASGRTLTAAQRTRKRAVDNRSHRERRNRTLSRISELEAKLEGLLEGKADKCGTKTRTEIASHEAKPQGLEHMPDLIATSWDMQDCVDTGTWTFSSPDDSITASSPENVNYGLSDYNSITNVASALESTNHTVLAAPELLLSSNVDQPFPRISAQDMVTNPSNISSIGIQTIDACESISTTQLCNMELIKASHLTSNQVCRDELVNQDFIARAVMQGWKSIERHGYFCPLWETLHRIDDLIFCTSSTITRLVMLYTVHRMLLCRTKAKSVKELPPWYRPRPAQRRFQHEAVMGYFAWPGLRERLVLSEKRILSESFWYYFAQCFRFNWPYDLAEAYNINLAGQIQFSGAFMNHLQDIRNWRMDYRFFSAFPELYDDITPTPMVPPLTTLPESSVELTADPSTGSTVESEELVVSDYLCSTSSPLPNLVIPSQDPWDLSQRDFWTQAVDSYFGLPT